MPLVWPLKGLPYNQSEIRKKPNTLDPRNNLSITLEVPKIRYILYDIERERERSRRCRISCQAIKARLPVSNVYEGLNFWHGWIATDKEKRNLARLHAEDPTSVDYSPRPRLSRSSRSLGFLEAWLERAVIAPIILAEISWVSSLISGVMKATVIIEGMTKFSMTKWPSDAPGKVGDSSFGRTSSTLAQLNHRHAWNLGPFATET